MPKMHRISRIVALSVCLFGSGWSDTVFASEPSAPSEVVSTPANSSALAQPLSAPLASRLAIGEQTRRAMTMPLAPSSQLGVSYAQRGFYRGGRRRNGAAQAEMVLGAVAAITGAAVLSYANRPACSVDALADGCSYGTKVVGTAVTAAGIATFLTGAITWR